MQTNITFFIIFVILISFQQIKAQPDMKTNQTNNKFNKTEFVPGWAKKVVWYQIFPERFRNGDKSNDPTIKDIKNSWPHDNTSPWEVHPWESDWYKFQPYEKENGKDIWFNIQRRRYGGDLQGIIDKLDYLKELGIGAIYLNPVFESPSLHKYDGATYHHVDPNFGPDPIGDRMIIKTEVGDDPTTWVWTKADKLFLKLVDEVHKRGMKIIIDGVFNHMGLNSWAFKDIQEKQQNSKYKDWFKIISWDDSTTGEKFDYEGWYGCRELPELKQDENGIVAGPKKYIFDITKRWMDPIGDGSLKEGIDGWRLDVAFMVKHKFWKDWRAHVKSINPEAYLTAEIVDKVEVNTPYLEGDEFDAVMNYNFFFTCSEYFIHDKYGINTTEFDKKLKELRDAYPDCVAYVQQNLFDSHDTQRIASQIVNKDFWNVRDWSNFFEKSKGDKLEYHTTKPYEEDYQIQKLMAIFQMTYLGAPMIYYGDEAGMWGANDPCCRKPMVWDDIKYEPEAELPDGSLREHSDIVEFDRDIFNHYKKLIHIRNEHPALQIGDYTTLLIDDENNLYIFERKDESESILVAINNDSESHTVKLNSDCNKEFFDLLNEEEIKIENGLLEFSIPAKWGRIIINK